jgi:uncharacterized protein with HEPN domain
MDSASFIIEAKDGITLEGYLSDRLIR